MFILRSTGRKMTLRLPLPRMQDDIEIAIASYADEMSQELLDVISGGRADFLRDHKRFKEDITKAVKILENML